VTRWHVINLPVRIGQRPEPWGTVAALWFVWEERRLEGVGVTSGWRRRWQVRYDETVRIGPEGVWVPNWDGVRSISPAAWRGRSATDRQGQGLSDASGRVLGFVKDVGFDPATGHMTTLWLTRGRLADVVQGMVSVPASAVSEDGSGISWMSTGDAVR